MIGAAIDVHTELGPRLLESTHEACLQFELVGCGLRVERQKGLPVVYRDVHIDCGYRIDLLVERRLVIEVKSVEALNEIHLAQVLTYLKIGHYKLGLLMNFNVVRLKEGIKRVVHGL